MSAEFVAVVSCLAMMTVAAPDCQATKALNFVRGARYPRRSFQLRSPGWRETKASEFFSQILQEPCGSRGNVASTLPPYGTQNLERHHPIEST